MGQTGSLAYLQKVDYSYNSLGWLTGINNPQTAFALTKPLASCFYPVNYNPSATDLDYNHLFSMELKYEAPVAALAPSGTTVTPQYGGNISQVTWQVRGRDKQAYTLNYDAVNRMTQATYSDISSAGTVTGNRFDEKLTYDIRGNINTLQRWGLNGSCTWGMIDNLTYNYGASGYNIKNQLNSVTEGSGGDLTKGFKTISNGSAYSYDTNGNMTADPNKGITNITYNHLNLPITITFTNSRSITFMYDAGGNKLRKTVVQGGTTPSTNVQDYVGGFEYKNSILEAIYHIEGRITTINSVLKYEYALKDHLGNTRIMFSDKNNDGLITQSTAQETSEVTQENSYYPFGLSMEGVWSNTPSVTDSKYLYNGKELNDDFGLGLMDYGARMYDATIGRWNVREPLTEFYPEVNPYNYCFNNPINFIDPLGLDTVKAGQTANKGDVLDYGDGTYSAPMVSKEGDVEVTATKLSKNEPENNNNKSEKQESLVSKTDNVFDRVDPALGGVEYKLGKGLEQRLAYYSTQSKYIDVDLPKLPATNIRLSLSSHIPTLATIKIGTRSAIKMAKTLKGVGILSAVVGSFKAYEDYQNGKYLKATCGAAAVGVGFIPRYGWIVSGAYGLFLEDMLFPEE
jgi:RHS repeat-associated protein